MLRSEGNEANGDDPMITVSHIRAAAKGLSERLACFAHDLEATSDLSHDVVAFSH